MKTVAELEQSIRQLYEDIKELRANEKLEEEQADLSKVYAIAKRNPLRSHRINQETEYVRKMYLQYLATIIIATKHVEPKYAQTLFFSRIVFGSETETGNTKDYLESALVSKINIDELLKCLSEELIELLIVDSLLLLGIYGEPDRKAFDYVAEMVSVFNVKSDKIVQLAKLARAILEQNDESILSFSRNSNLNLYLCYMKNPYEGVIVYSLEAAMKEPAKKVILFNAEISNRAERVNLDEFVAEEIVFERCVINNVIGFVTENKKVFFQNTMFTNIHFADEEQITGLMGFLYRNKQKEEKFPFLKLGHAEIHNCKFEACDVGKELVSVLNGTVENCKFLQCRGIEVGHKAFLVAINKGDLARCVFEECSIRTDFEDRGHTSAGIASICSGKVSDCTFLDCSSYGKSTRLGYSTYSMYILALKNAVATNCVFENCSCSQKGPSTISAWNHIIALENSHENNNSMTKCFSEHYYNDRNGGNKLVGEVKDY